MVTVAVFQTLNRDKILNSYFIPVWGIVKIAAPRCRGQLDALLPDYGPNGRGQWCIELSTVPRASSFVYSAKQPWHNCFITQPMLKIPVVLSPRNATLTGKRRWYTQLTSWRSTSFSWYLTSSTRQKTKLLPDAFPLRLNGWRHKRGIVDSMDRLVTSYEWRYMCMAAARAN